MDTGEFIRRSANTRSWAKAEKLVRHFENLPDLAPRIPPPPAASQKDASKPASEPKRIKIEETAET
jgi:hypothetical protein